ncbi:unnamed protein product [Acanthosepion pharaonis]|uniref:Uncharacterized protein n=1 Tax=Acanthosepion pharaonis TaxID=158019 RepID=A0A812CUB5_ACAPH|nr:unnamed protein product [Sepia pharaonis]
MLFNIFTHPQFSIVTEGLLTDPDPNLSASSRLCLYPMTFVNLQESLTICRWRVCPKLTNELRQPSAPNLHTGDVIVGCAYFFQSLPLNVYVFFVIFFFVFFFFVLLVSFFQTTFLSFFPLFNTFFLKNFKLLFHDIRFFFILFYSFNVLIILFFLSFVTLLHYPFFFSFFLFVFLCFRHVYSSSILFFFLFFLSFFFSFLFLSSFIRSFVCCFSSFIPFFLSSFKTFLFMSCSFFLSFFLSFFPFLHPPNLQPSRSNQFFFFFRKIFSLLFSL